MVDNKYIKLILTKPNIIISGEPLADPKSLPQPIAHPKAINNFASIPSSAEQFVLTQKLVQYHSYIVELGSGSGNHLIERAKASPENLFLGYELRFKRIFRTAEKCEQEGLSNVLLLRNNGLKILELFAEETISGLYINFPDPWEKRRWHKHRLLNESFLISLAKILRRNAFFSFKTDHQDYFEEVLEAISRLPCFEISKMTQDLHSSDFEEKQYRSEFENLFISKHQPVNFLQAIRV